MPQLFRKVRCERSKKLQKRLVFFLRNGCIEFHTLNILTDFSYALVQEQFVFLSGSSVQHIGKTGDPLQKAPNPNKTVRIPWKRTDFVIGSDECEIGSDR